MKSSHNVALHGDLFGTDYILEMREISYFRPSEEVNADNVRHLAECIAKANFWTAPIPVHRDTGIVMDGNHRIQAARLLGLTHLPCVPMDYGDRRVSVFHWETGEPFAVDHIFRTLDSNNVLPYKTTRHLFSPQLPQTDIPLPQLRAADHLAK